MTGALATELPEATQTVEDQYRGYVAPHSGPNGFKADRDDRSLRYESDLYRIYNCATEGESNPRLPVRAEPGIATRSMGAYEAP